MAHPANAHRPDEHNDWVAEFEADLAASKEAEYPVLRLVRVGQLV